MYHFLCDPVGKFARTVGLDLYQTAPLGKPLGKQCYQGQGRRLNGTVVGRYHQTSSAENALPGKIHFVDYN